MKHLPIITVILAAAMVLSACGAPAAPTMNPADVQATAMVAAQTMIALTQAAIPTNTPLPPTDTPTQTALPTDTAPPLPTLDALASPTTAAVSGGAATVDPCSTRVISSPKGENTTIRIWNSTKVPITVSLYLNPTKGHGECGYRSYTLGKNADVIITDLVYGCYDLWAWSDDPKGKFNSGGGGCINNPDKWTFEVTAAMIKFTGP